MTKNAYTVGTYDISKPGEGRAERQIMAESAEEAIAVVRRERGYLDIGFSFTRKAQNHPKPEVRDNAHCQFDQNGFRGCWAARTGFVREYEVA